MQLPSKIPYSYHPFFHTTNKPVSFLFTGKAFPLKSPVILLTAWIFPMRTMDIRNHRIPRRCVASYKEALGKCRQLIKEHNCKKAKQKKVILHPARFQPAKCLLLSPAAKKLLFSHAAKGRFLNRKRSGSSKKSLLRYKGAHKTVILKITIMASVRRDWQRNNGYLVKAGYPLFFCRHEKQ